MFSDEQPLNVVAAPSPVSALLINRRRVNGGGGIGDAEMAILIKALVLEVALHFPPQHPIQRIGRLVRQPKWI